MLEHANSFGMLTVEVMEALARTIDAKDQYTKSHSQRVGMYAHMLAKRLSLPPEELEKVYFMGLLHDIGKIGIPNVIINKPLKLTEEEYSLMKAHTTVGFDILNSIQSMPELAQAARWHHEHLDGTGYPDGLSGDKIPFLVRIICMADCYDAMASKRCYRGYLPQDFIRKEIERNKGTQFDPDIANCMLSIIDDDVIFALHD